METEDRINSGDIYMWQNSAIITINKLQLLITSVYIVSRGHYQTIHDWFRKKHKQNHIFIGLCDWFKVWTQEAFNSRAVYKLRWTKY